MESIERLLAELKAEYQESQKKSAELKSQGIVQPELLWQANAVPSNQAIETSGENLHFGGFDQDLAQVKAEYEKQDQAQEVAKQERLLAEDEAQNKAQEMVNQEQQQVETVFQQQVPVRTHREKVRQAQVWLKNLSKDSDERFWFDQFAFKYSSRIDAAIDYLQAVNEFN
ncbi:salt stress protein, Slr1339 family [Tychonema sp. BBK16]|uniref:salt stress protein, Slr1339 family n=1 Tax=Tychonema sp. BBK16 TaxID=2699888 RepID=UPI001F23C43E|nr:hypothetical protein [Tychonema sp. BBK16]MCF6372350.1 hypothetical protein [Tychonema sp. BBK16]